MLSQDSLSIQGLDWPSLYPYSDSMGSPSRGTTILRSAEKELRSAMERAIASGRYSELSELARFADGLNDLLTRRRTSIEAASAQDAREPVAGNASAAKSNRHSKAPLSKSVHQSKSKSKYPRFEIVNAWITKVGWSKREREEYRHHAPVTAALALAKHIDQSQPSGQLWTVEGLGDISCDSPSGCLPGYQVYLLIAWMRHTGLLIKSGRSGYTAVRGARLLHEVEQTLGVPRRARSEHDDS